MATANSNKPAKPHIDFPLYSHRNGQWAKKVKGKTHFFGPWNNPQAALERWLDEKDDLLAGRIPRSRNGDASTVMDLRNAFLEDKRMNVSDQVREAVKNSDWPLSRIAEAVDMKTPPLWRFVNQGNGIRLDAFGRLCDFFEMRLTKPKDPKISAAKEKSP